MTLKCHLFYGLVRNCSISVSPESRITLSANKKTTVSCGEGEKLQYGNTEHEVVCTSKGRYIPTLNTCQGNILMFFWLLYIKSDLDL